MRQLLSFIFGVILLTTTTDAAPARRTVTASRNTTARTSVSARSATAPKTPSTTKGIVARAGAKQNVVNVGTKVAAATENTAINQSCQDKFNGCMDSLCMIENTNGGRCICSNKIFDLDKQLAEIAENDTKSYQLATIGVESIESGVDIAEQKRIAAAAKKPSINLSLWDNTDDTEGEDTPAPDTTRGIKKFNQATSVCASYIPECSDKIDILKTIYNQKIKSDCTAYENALKEQFQDSINKLNAAKMAMRAAALEQVQNANKYDLGQCTIEFRKCMQTTAGCGEDFSGCAAVAAIENTNTRRVSARAAKNYVIKGSATSIEIAASTYEQLESKKPICESITKQCASVADQVWDTFLRDIAPTIKNAELIAENKVRQDCIGNISNCFQKACKDNIDPKDPDGSYDMCLTRPETMLNVCRVPLNTCGISAESATAAEQSPIWEYVVARLGAMRVNSCTTAVRECLTADDRCGKDYLGCVGLDTNTIIRMCPYDKLTGCQQKYGDTDIRGDAVYNELATMVQGIMLNIDNNLLTECQNAVNESMLRVCGDLDECNALTTDENIGIRSLEYKLCQYGVQDNQVRVALEQPYCHTDVSQITDKELGRVEGSTTGKLGPTTPYMGMIDGTIYWELVDIGADGKLSSADEYFKAAEFTDDVPDVQRQRIRNELGTLQSNIDRVIATIESDPTVQFCMTGREVMGMKQLKFGDKNAPRFPNLTTQTRMQITNNALKAAKDNYYRRYDELNEQMLRDYGIIAERRAEIMGENAKDARREAARQSCIGLAESSTLPKSPNPPRNFWGALIIGLIVVAVTVVALVCTAGAAAPGIATGVALAVKVFGITATTSSIATAAGAAAAATAITAAIAAGAGAVAAGITAGINAGASGSANSDNVAMERELSGFYEMNQWNYRDTVSTTFNWETLNCHKCNKTQRCVAILDPIFGNKSCKKWADPEETCTDIQF